MASSKEVFEIGTLLRRYCHKNAEGAAFYETGWSDQMVADRVGVSVNSVRRVRAELVGPLRTAGDELRAADLIKLHTIKQTDGTVSYIDGWSDERIALETGCNIYRIARIRKDTVGLMYSARGSAKGGSAISEVRERLEEAEETIKGLLIWIRKLEKTVDMLLDYHTRQDRVAVEDNQRPVDTEIAGSVMRK